MRSHFLSLEVLADDYVVCQLPPGASVSGKPWCVIRTPEETSVVCVAGEEPAGARVESGWSMLKLEGTYEFSEIGILARVLPPLADARVGILVVSSFDTDYILVRKGQVETAIASLRVAGHSVKRL